MPRPTAWPSTASARSSPAGVAAKLGLFAKLGALLLAFKKFIIIGVIAIGGCIAKMFGKKKDEAA